MSDNEYVKAERLKSRLMGLEDGFSACDSEIAKLRADNKALLDALKAFPKQADPTPEGDCIHGEEWDLCDTCKYEWEQAVAAWITVRRAAIEHSEPQ